MRGEVVIARGDRVTIIGRTGSGKSVALRYFLQGYSRGVLVDPKGRASMPGWPVVYGSAAFVKAWPATSPHVVARLGPGEDRRAWFDAVCWHIYRVGEAGVGIDEVAGVTSSSKPSTGLDVLLMQGRELGLTVYVCTQRPLRIPPTLLSEVDHILVYTLQRRDDVEAVADVIGDYRSPPHGSYRFVYWAGDLTAPIESAPLPLRV